MGGADRGVATAVPASVADAEDVEREARRFAETFVTPQRYPRKVWELDLLRKGTPLTLAGRLSAVSWGEGPVVLLLHGWEGRGTQLGAFVEPLVATGRRVVALDGIAHGDSPGTTTNIARSTEMMLALGQEFGPLDGMIAHSMGASVTLLALTRGLSVPRAVLIAAAARLQGVLDRYAAAHSMSLAVHVRFQAMVEEMLGAPAALFDITRAAPSPDCSVLVVHDEADREVPFADAGLIVAAWPGAKLLATKGYGHRRILQAPSVVHASVAFLAEEE